MFAPLLLRVTMLRAGDGRATKYTRDTGTHGTSLAPAPTARYLFYSIWIF